MKKAEASHGIVKHEMFDEVFERIAVGIAIYNLNGEIIYTNSTYAEMTGYTVKELTGKQYLDLMSKDYHRVAAAELNNLIEGTTAKFEHVGSYTRKDGTISWHQMTFTVSKNAKNEPEFIILVAEDITEQKRSELLQQIIYNISNAVNSTSDLPDLIRFIQKELGKIMDTSNFYVALYNRAKDALSLPYFSDDKDQFNEFSAGNTLSGHVIHSGKALFGTKEKIRELEQQGVIELVGTDCQIWLGVPLRVSGEIIGMLGIQSYTDENAYSENDLAVLEFISSQIGISIDKKRTEDELRIERIFFRKIFENLAEAVVIGFKDGTITSINDAFTNLFGYTMEEVIGVNINDLIIPDGYMEEALGLRRKVADNEIFQIQTKRKCKDGAIVDVSIIGTPFYVDNVLYSCVIYRDIREQMQSEAMLKQAKEKAEESDRLKTAFLANMSHEIRTPMNAIIGFVELLSTPDLSVSDKLEYIAVINNSGKILLNLIDDIIDLAKIEADQLKIEYDNCNLQELMQEVYSHYSKELKVLGKEKIELRLRNKLDGHLFVRTDPFRVKQILHNLIGNAIKFTHEGFVEFGIDGLENDVLKFYVRDTGIGIPKDKHELIFNRFLQVDNSGTRKYGGTGLGLTISKKLTSLLGGEMWLESKVQKGSVFYFTIKTLPVEETSKESPPPNYFVEKNAWIHKKILVVEDNVLNYQLIEELLKKTGAEIIWASSASESIQIVENRVNIDLVLMDIQMPDMSGYEATRKIKQINPDIPVIAQTAYAMSDERQKAIECGCDEYLVKPLRPMELIAALNQYL